MKELDLLKKNWNKDELPKVSADDIYNMILKKSSSTVKWIFIISTLELAFGLFAGFCSNPKINTLNVPAWFDSATSIISICIALIFIVIFYKNYKTISITNSVKGLLKTIVKTRHSVRLYVIINLGFMAILVITMLSYALTTPSPETGQILFEIHGIKDYFILGGIICVITIMAVGIFLGIYFLLYGILMRKLNKNYKELKQIDL